jgi:S-adenosylmethionine hydrolase
MPGMPGTDDSRERPVLAILTDFGLDGAVAACKGVILGICRDAQIIDVGHSIRKYAINDGAFLLGFALPHVPVGVHIGVVDPGVGTPRRPIGIRTGRGDVLIGPDNGLLMPAADALGGAIEARELTNRDLWLPVTSSTFHGRDIFAPVAAHLASGDVPFSDVGEPIPVGDLVRLPEPTAVATSDAIATSVTYVDSFGNARLAGGAAELSTAFGELADGEPLHVELEDPAALEAARYATTFGAVDVGQSLVYLDSVGSLAIADNQGNLAARLGVERGRAVRITRAPR